MAIGPIELENALADDSLEMNEAGDKLRVALALQDTIAAHHTHHQKGGSDELDVTGLSGELADSQKPKSHAPTHADGGTDELNVGGLSGELADPQKPKLGNSVEKVLIQAAEPGVSLLGSRLDHKHDVLTAFPVALVVGGANVVGTSAALAPADHKHGLPAFGTAAGTFCEGNDARLATPAAHAARHADGGADELSVTGLSGKLADAQTPLAHKASHQDGGADEIAVNGLSGQLADPQIAGWLKTASTYVMIVEAAAPTPGQVLTAISSEQAAWQTPATNAIVNGFRLAFSATAPIPDTASASPSTLYLVPFRGDRISLWQANPSRWVLIKPPSQVSLGLSGLAQWALYDVYAYIEGANVQLEIAQWQTDKVRGAGAAIGYQDGVLVKVSDPSRRWVGTFRASSGNTIAWNPVSGVDGGASNVGLFNADNRVQIPVFWYLNVGWTITPTQAWRPWTGGNVPGFEIVTGIVPSDAISMQVSASVQLTNGSSFAMAVSDGNGTNTPVGIRPHVESPGTGTRSHVLTGHNAFQPGLGLRQYVALAYADASGVFINGTGPLGGHTRSGMTGLVWC